MKTTNALSSIFANGIEAVQDVGNYSENIEAFILTIRGKQVLLDRDLAMLYNVETKVLNQAIKRNQERFPERFRFQLPKRKWLNWSQIVTGSAYLNIPLFVLLHLQNKVLPCYQRF